MIEYNEEHLTDWFHGNMRPREVGFYWREYELETPELAPDFWDGFYWRYADEDQNVGQVCAVQNRRWRGCKPAAQINFTGILQ